MGEQGTNVVGLEFEVLDGRRSTGDAEAIASAPAKVQ